MPIFVGSVDASVGNHLDADLLRAWLERAQPDAWHANSQPPALPGELIEQSLSYLDVYVSELEDDDGFDSVDDYVLAILHAPDPVFACSRQRELAAAGPPRPLLDWVDGDSDLVADDVTIDACSLCAASSAALRNAMRFGHAIEHAAEMCQYGGDELLSPSSDPHVHAAELADARRWLDFGTPLCLHCQAPPPAVDGADPALQRWLQDRHDWYRAALAGQLCEMRAQQPGWDGPLKMVTPKRPGLVGVLVNQAGASGAGAPVRFVDYLLAAPLLGLVPWDPTAGGTQPVLAVPVDLELSGPGAEDLWVSLGPVRDGDALTLRLTSLPALFALEPENQAEVDGRMAALTTALSL